eukprot:gene44321-60018_t
MDGDVRINPYLAGNFAPVRSEDDFDLKVTGEIPAGLRGALFRIGPNPQFEPLDPNHHWFGGDGMSAAAMNAPPFGRPTVLARARLFSVAIAVLLLTAGTAEAAFVER